MPVSYLPYFLSVSFEERGRKLFPTASHTPDLWSVENWRSVLGRLRVLAFGDNNNMMIGFYDRGLRRKDKEFLKGGLLKRARYSIGGKK